jgi:hypothetical protein
MNARPSATNSSKRDPASDRPPRLPGSTTAVVSDEAAVANARRKCIRVCPALIRSKVQRAVTEVSGVAAKESMAACNFALRTMHWPRHCDQPAGSGSG